MNIFRNIMRMDKEKLFFRTYTGMVIGMYFFMVSGLYAGNSLHKEEIEAGTYEKLSHLDIHSRSLSVALSWIVVIPHIIFKDEKKDKN